MIAVGKSLSHTAISIEYAKSKVIKIKDEHDRIVVKQASFEVDRHLVWGETAQEIAADFRVFQRNSRIKNNTFQFVISPSPEIGKTFTMHDWKKLTNEFITRLAKMLNQPELVDQARIAFVHADRKHRHLHLYINRILSNNQAIKDNFISNKASKIAEEIAINRDWKTANQIKAERQEELKMEDEAYFITTSISKVLDKKPKNLDDFCTALWAIGIGTNRKYDSKNILRGISFEYKGKQYKASDIRRDLAGGKIEETLLKNRISVSNELKDNKQNNKKQKL